MYIDWPTLIKKTTAAGYHITIFNLDGESLCSSGNEDTLMSFLRCTDDAFGTQEFLLTNVDGSNLDYAITDISYPGRVSPQTYDDIRNNHPYLFSKLMESACI